MKSGRPFLAAKLRKRMHNCVRYLLFPNHHLLPCPLAADNPVPAEEEDAHMPIEQMIKSRLYAGGDYVPAIQISNRAKHFSQSPGLTA